MLSAGISGYAGARGVLGALKARGPRQNLVEELLSLGDAEAVAARLRALPMLEGRSAATDLAGLERDLRQAVYTFGMKLAAFIGGPAKGFIETYLLHYHVHNLEVLFRRALSKETGAAGLYPIGPFNPTDRQLAGLDSPEKVVEFAQGTELQAMALEAFEAYRAGEGDLFRWELSLERQYLARVWQAAGRVLPPESWRLKKTLVVPFVGMTAFVWALGLKRYRKTGGAELAALLPMPKDLLDAGALAEIARNDDLAAAAEEIPSKELRGLVRAILAAQRPEGPAGWHRTVKRVVWRQLSTKKLRATFDITTLMTALMGWEYVVADAITVANGKALGLERERIETLLATTAA